MSSQVFEPVTGERRYEAVVRQLLELIARGEIAPATQLPPERDLAERLQVSRNVLREAIRVLEVRGIVHSRAGGGRYVRADNLAPTLSPDGVVLRLEQAVIADVLEARELLEVQIAGLAAQRGNADGLQALVRESGDSWADNVRLHTAVAAATGNFMLERLVRLQMDLLQEVHQRDRYRAPATARELLAEHQLIVDAIAARDPERARAAMRHHLRHTRSAVTAPAEH